MIRTKPEVFKEAKQAVDLTQAQIIVAVGRGIKEQKNIAIAQQLADALGGEIAASRPICDAGWLPMERQVGSCGQTVSPKLYLALGISGAIQHLVGMKGSRNVIAVNKDAEAPIFEIADVAVVGNLFEIVPALTEEVKKQKALESEEPFRVARFGFLVSRFRVSGLHAFGWRLAFSRLESPFWVVAWEAFRYVELYRRYIPCPKQHRNL